MGASASTVKLTKSEQCDGTECPGGCCPYVGWYCCPDGMYCAATAADCPFLPKKNSLPKWLPTSSVMELNVQEDAVHMLDGIAAQMVCTVLLLLLTVHLLPRRQPLPRWLPTGNVMVLNAQEDAAHMLDGTAAQMVCTVLLLLLTAHLLLRRQTLSRWLPKNSVMVLSAQEEAAHMLDGTAAQMVCTAL